MSGSVKFSLHLVCSALCFLAFFHPPAAQAEVVDRIIAIVNDDVITFSDLNREGAALFRRITQEAPPEQVERTLLKAKEEVLSSLIDRLIVEQRAKKLGISVGDPEVDSAIARIVERNKTTAEKFWQQMTLMGSNERDYRELIRSQILQERLIDYEIRSRVVVNEEKEDAYHVLQMGFVWKENTQAAKDDARRRAEEARRQAFAGQDFRTLARQASDLPSAKDGGDIGVFRKSEMAAYMKAGIAGLQVGQVSDIQEAPDGYQFFKLLSDRGDVAIQAPYETVKDQIRQRLYEDALKNQFQKWVTELRDQAYIKKIL
ncbi:MAG: peptidylprolyl isomerase [Deltaproteobacteria bacterium HGW-Deltaproteobacteria-3]|nr:MAG: peptidylprolyl isomerase [Deltaproteobacteria bacterium HGW-Deltaproteobacteria-3]